MDAKIGLKAAGTDNPPFSSADQHLRAAGGIISDPMFYPQLMIAGCAVILRGTGIANSPRLSRDREVILYCTSPRDFTSAWVALALHQRGFQRVRPLAGGLRAWRERGFPSVLGVTSAPKAFDLALISDVHGIKDFLDPESSSDDVLVSMALQKAAETLLPHTYDFASECHMLGTACMWAVDAGRMNFAVRPRASDFNDMQDARVGM